VFLLSKRATYYYDADAIREPMLADSVGPFNYAFKGTPERNEQMVEAHHGKGYMRSEEPPPANPAGRNKRSVWTIATQPFGLEMCGSCKHIYDAASYRRLKAGSDPQCQTEVAEDERCGGTRVNWQDYGLLRPPRTKKNGQTVVPDPAKVTTLQCLLREKKVFEGPLTGEYGAATLKATRAWQAKRGFEPQDLWSRQHWMSLLAVGSKATIKYGSSGLAVRRLQRALNAASPQHRLVVTGVYGPGVEPVVKAWQKKVGLQPSGVVNRQVWRALIKGKRS